jgi:ribonuclease E
VNAAIRDALKPRVDLPSGGYVIIEPTEALTVIDVNSGSFTRSANARETVLWTNCEAAVEIARQLRLRNIGGVVIVDFIDMDSRRDQLQLLEHFTQAIRHDSARPQVAQLTELGLVELTRKRQGQNIYELFGRACPSCGGLGHVAVLPGRDTLQPLATVSGLVRSTASARAEVTNPVALEAAGGGRRRRGGRGGRMGDGGEAGGVSDSLAAAEDSPFSPGEEGEADQGPRRQEPEVVAVPMDDSQEQVYGWMGLSPALLLESPAAADNLVVRIVRPGSDPEAVLEEARQQLAASGSRRRRRGRGGGEGRQGSQESAAEQGASRETLIEIPLVEITPLPLVQEESSRSLELLSVDAPLHRRAAGGRGQLASADQPAVLQQAAAAEPHNGDLFAEPDASGEPRRRRRRSSASA